MDFKCEHCKATFQNNDLYKRHMELERDVFIPGKEGVDYIVCKECGLRGKFIGGHIKQVHGMEVDDYRKKHGSPVSVGGPVRQGATFKCEHCGGEFKTDVPYYLHMKREREEFINGKEGIDYVVCRECGMRGKSLNTHIVTHGITVQQYMVKYSGSQITLDSVHNQQHASNIGKHSKPLSENAHAKTCEKCGELYDAGKPGIHITACIAKNPTLWMEEKDYLKCPECQMCLRILPPHLSQVHGWTKEKFSEERAKGMKFMTTSAMDEQKKTNVERFGTEHHWQNEEVKQRREDTWVEKYGVTNPFASKEIQDKIDATNIERYGVIHPMQNVDVFIKQQEACQNNRPTEPEKFLIEHCNCRNLVYTDRIRVIRIKQPVFKNGKWQQDVNPDFMVFPSNVLESAIECSRLKKRMDATKHNSKHIIEVFGDYYHSMKKTGILECIHVKQYIAGYASSGIKCLVLWEKELNHKAWEEGTQAKVEAFLQDAVLFEDKRYAEKLTKPWQDKRKAHLTCSNGSGERFKTQADLDAWNVSECNLWRPGLVEGEDYVVCRICGKRFEKLGVHIAKEHKISVEQYQNEHPGVLMVPSKYAVDLKVSAAKTWAKRQATPKPEKSIEVPEGVAGYDWVKCTLCDHYGENITRHVKDVHGMAVFEGYAAPLRSKKCEETFKAAAKKTWDTRGRTEKPDKALNKTHKQHGLTKEILEAHVTAGLSDAKIGELYSMTGEGIAYQRKKFGIEKTSSSEKAMAAGIVLLKDAAVVLNVTVDVLQHWVVADGLTGRDLTLDDYRAVKERRDIPEGSGTIEDVEGIIHKGNVRKAREWLKKNGVEPIGKFGRFEYYDLDDVKAKSNSIVEGN